MNQIDKDRVYLLHIKKRVNQILEFTNKGRQEFYDNEQIQLAAKAAFHEIGDSIARVSDNLKSKYPEIPWREVKDFRNVVVHDYLGLDYDKVWEIIETELPNLGRNIDKIIDNKQN